MDTTILDDNEALMESADVMAAADAASDLPDVPEEKSAQAREQEAVAAAEQEDESEVVFHRPYPMGDGKMVDRLDLSGLSNLTTKDGEYADRVLAKMDHAPQNKFADVLYCKHLAVRATGISLEFFNMLDLRDMLLIVARINYFFLYG